MRGSIPPILALIIVLATPAVAQSKPINIALITPIQIFSTETRISGFRWNILYGRNVRMTGLDIGLANHVTGPMSGVQLGVANITGSMQGWQYGVVNYAERHMEGLQWGVVNYAGSTNGLQLAIVNYARRADGVQVGLVNFITENGAFPVMILANWGKN